MAGFKNIYWRFCNIVKLNISHISMISTGVRFILNSTSLFTLVHEYVTFCIPIMHQRRELNLAEPLGLVGFLNQTQFVVKFVFLIYLNYVFTN